MNLQARSLFFVVLISLFIAVSLLLAVDRFPEPALAAQANTETATLPFRPDGWVTLMTENFDGVFPAPGWHVGREGDPYLWGQSTCHPHSGSYSVGSHMGGSQGSLLTCDDEYPLNYVTTLSYGPFDLTDCTDMRVNYSHLTKLSLIDDYFSVGYSIDGGVSWKLRTYNGDLTEYCDGWCEWSIGAEQYDIPLCGQPKVYLLFRFQSDWIYPGFGSWVDDVSLEALYETLPNEDMVYIPYMLK